MIILNLNANSHFSVNPIDIDIGRSRFERPKRHLFTGNVSDLIPAYWTEILPGDTVSMKLSAVFRMSTILDPVMDNLYADINWFFVPMRLCWSHTKEFFGENTQGAWAPSVTYTIPQTTFSSGAAVQSVADYMGIPVGVTGLSVSSLPFRAYGRVYDEWWRDENLITPPALYYGDATEDYRFANPLLGGAPFKVSKFRDYLTSCLPGPQRGEAVQVPLSGTVPINFGGTIQPVTAGSSAHNMGSYLRMGPSTSPNSYFDKSNIADSDGLSDAMFASGAKEGWTHVLYSNLQVQFPNSVDANFDGVSPITVNDLRLAFQMQRWLEKSALFGGRYTSMLRAQFGITPADATLQRSEYLGGKRIPLNVQQVENNSASDGQPLGKLGAYSHTSDSDDYFTKSFQEHGFLLCTVCFRYKHSYSQAINREWSRKTMWDYYFPVMANLGNMPVLRKEVYADGTDGDNDVWGYQEAWAEYRYSQDQVSGFFRPGINGSLSSWHYGDYYASAPTLSSGWIEEDKAPVDRTLAVPSSNSVPQLLCDMYFNPVFVRAMPLYSVPGLIDHH